MSTVAVTITIRRAKVGVEVDVDPFVAEISPEDEIQWTVESDEDVKKVDIVKKKNDIGPWPFDAPPPADIPKGGSKKSGKVKADAKERTSYDVTGKCEIDGEKVDFHVDPDIIIIRKI